MNTVRAERGIVRDDLQHPADLTAWLAAAGLSAPRCTAADLRAARSLRDALRTIAAYVTCDERPADDVTEALDVVNAHRTSTPADHLVLTDGVLRRRAAPAGQGVADGLAAVSAATVDLLTGRASPALRACSGPRCVRYFVQDHPRRAWCSPACGDRARAARYYRRHRDG